MSIARPIDLAKIKVLPLESRRSLSSLGDVLVQLGSSPSRLPVSILAQIQQCAQAVLRAKERRRSIILMYGAHLLRNGAALILNEMMRRGWITHVATNGAGTIHDWEYAWLGRSTESVEQNVASGTFGAWDETGRNIHLALYAGGIAGGGYGISLGQFIQEDGADFPEIEELQRQIREFPADENASARSDLLRAMLDMRLPEGRCHVGHRWKEGSILASAYRHGVPATVHPGIGYDIIACHPMFNGAVIGRAADRDFRLFAGAVDNLDAGVVLSVGSAIMAPQVFEKSLSCVHNLRFQQGRPPVKDFKIYVVDLQDGGGWDWSAGEPPKSNPAYYLRFCKSFSRMGGAMSYVQADNLAFMHNLYLELNRLSPA